MTYRSVVPKGGLEPPRVAPHAPQTCASANSATSAPAKAQYAAPPRALSIHLAAEAQDAADAGLAQARVERVADPLAHQIVGEHRDEDGQARIEGQPPGDLDVVAPVVENVPPRGGWRPGCRASWRPGSARWRWAGCGGR